MCGIVGLFAKNTSVENKLGDYLSSMLIEMCERGPDSSGIAIYQPPVRNNINKTTIINKNGIDKNNLQELLKRKFGEYSKVQERGTHLILSVPASLIELDEWISNEMQDVSITSSGEYIEIFKSKGPPQNIVKNFNLRDLKGTHALGHTRMATESAVTVEHSHPFSTGMDLCLVHNGSLSNHNRLREKLIRKGIKFKTDNDSEVAAGFLTWRLQEGDTLKEALNMCLTDLDGFYTFAVGTRDGFAVLRDPIACKPAIMAETEDWAAMASEFRAIATLPGVEHAKIWEPEPEIIYSWERN